MRPRSTAAVLAWAAWAVIVGAVAAIVWLDHLMRRAGREDLGMLDAAGLIFTGGVLTAATLGAVVVWRARHVVGWFMIGLAASVVSSGLSEAYTAYGVLVAPGAVPAARWASPFSEAMFWPAFTFLALIMLFTPTGRLPSPGSTVRGRDHRRRGAVGGQHPVHRRAS